MKMLPRVRVWRSLAVAAVLLTLASIQAGAQKDASAQAPIVRFQRVDEHLDRGGQPDAAGFRYLRDLGVRTVINLRDDESAVAERELVESLGMRYVNLPMNVGNFFIRSRTIPLTRFSSSSP